MTTEETWRSCRVIIDDQAIIKARTIARLRHMDDRALRAIISKVIHSGEELSKTTDDLHRFRRKDLRSETYLEVICTFKLPGLYLVQRVETAHG